ncbi:hypothetical protein IGI04_042815, partial [Brassica rapa subsp. trilocularis]
GRPVRSRVVRVGLLELNRGLELGNLPGPVRERREGVAGRGRSRVVSSRRDSTKPRATLECRSRKLALSWSDFKMSLWDVAPGQFLSSVSSKTRATLRCRSHNVAPSWSDPSTSLRDLALRRFFSRSDDENASDLEHIYGPPRYYFKPHDGVLPPGALRDAHDHIGRLQRWNKAQDRTIEKLKDKCKALSKTVKKQAKTSAKFMKKVADVLTRGGIAGCSSADFAFANTSNPQPPPPPDALGFPLTAAQLQRKWRNPPTQPSTSGKKSPSLASSDNEDEIGEVESQPWYGGSGSASGGCILHTYVSIRYLSTTWSFWRHLGAFGAQRSTAWSDFSERRHEVAVHHIPERLIQSDCTKSLAFSHPETHIFDLGATFQSDVLKSLPKLGATIPERQGEVARVFITRRRENEPGATSRSNTARSLPKPGATCRSDGLRSLRVLFLLEPVISQGTFVATKRRVIFVLRKTTKNLWKVISLNQLISFVIEILYSYLFPVFLYMINLKSNMGLRGIMEIMITCILGALIPLRTGSTIIYTTTFVLGALKTPNINQPMLVRIFDELKPQKRFKMIDGKGKAMLVAQDQDPNKMLNGERTTTYYECLVASEVTLWGAVSTLFGIGTPELHSIRDMVQRSHDRKKLVGTPASIPFLNSMMDQDRERLLFGRSHQTIMRNPPCLVLGGMYRVRHELHLRNNELFVSTRG